MISGDKLLAACHVGSDDASLVHSTEELDMLVDASYNEGVLNETEAEMLHNMFKFSDLMAKQVMIPRTDMICIPSNITYDELTAFALENQYTRYPVFEENIVEINVAVLNRHNRICRVCQGAFFVQDFNDTVSRLY